MINLLSLLDDIATTLDDVSIMTKVAIEKTSVLMSDDLAVNAGVVTGTTSERELPIVKAIFLGSLLNKVYCIAGTLVLMAVYAPILNIILFIGGLYLAFEGVHKIVEKLFHKKDKDAPKKQVSEKEKIKGAVRTDFVLSIEIILISQRAIAETAKEELSFLMEVASLSAVGILASIIIYGLVAVLVKVDDFGLYLVNKGQKGIGMALVKSMPYTMKALGVIGTIAMLLVGGDIIDHQLHLSQYIPADLFILQKQIVSIVLAMIAGGILLYPVDFAMKKLKK